MIVYRNKTMDHGKVLVNELAREEDSYRPYEENDGNAVFGDHEYLRAHVPDEGDVVKAFQELAYANGERSVIPFRIFNFLVLFLSTYDVIIFIFQKIQDI
jgi:hypothetical protein